MKSRAGFERQSQHTTAGNLFAHHLHHALYQLYAYPDLFLLLPMVSASQI